MTSASTRCSYEACMEICRTVDCWKVICAGNGEHTMRSVCSVSQPRTELLGETARARESSGQERCNELVTERECTCVRGWCRRFKKPQESFLGAGRRSSGALMQEHVGTRLESAGKEPRPEVVVGAPRSLSTLAARLHRTMQSQRRVTCA